MVDPTTFGTTEIDFLVDSILEEPPLSADLRMIIIVGLKTNFANRGRKSALSRSEERQLFRTGKGRMSF